MVIDEDTRRKSFDKQKKDLHSTYKKYKVGLITQDDLSDDEIFLLMKYYGLRFEREE